MRARIRPLRATARPLQEVKVVGICTIVMKLSVPQVVSEHNPSPYCHSAGLEILYPCFYSTKIPLDEICYLTCRVPATASHILKVELVQDHPIQGKCLISLQSPIFAVYLVGL